MYEQRQRLAQRRLNARPVNRVVFVCLGNVCRSPYAHAALLAEDHELTESSSAGFILPGRPPPDTALTAAMKRGVDHSEHRSTILTVEMAREADAIFIFDRLNAMRIARTSGPLLMKTYWLGDFDPEWTGKRAIIDPWGGSQEKFDSTFARIDRCVEAVLGHLGDQRGHPMS